MSVPPVAHDEDDFESFDMMGVADPDSPLHADDMVVDRTIIPTNTEPCPNCDECGSHAAMLFEVSIGQEFRQCLAGCGVFMVLEG